MKKRIIFCITAICLLLLLAGCRSAKSVKKEQNNAEQTTAADTTKNSQAASSMVKASPTPAPVPKADPTPAPIPKEEKPKSSDNNASGSGKSANQEKKVTITEKPPEAPVSTPEPTPEPTPVPTPDSQPAEEFRPYATMIGSFESYVYPESDSRILSQEEIMNTDWIMYLGACEILARHGCYFDNDLGMQDFFDSRDWYSGGSVYYLDFDKENGLSEIELANYRLLLGASSNR